MWFDTHAHFPEDPARTLERARAAGLAGLLAVGGGPVLNAGAIAAARHAPGFAALALGWERGQAGRVSAEQALDLLRVEVERCRAEALAPVAIGEIGLDYHHSAETAAEQRELFERQVALAAEWGLPVVVHSREAEADTLAILRAVGSRALAAAGRLGVLHCFTGGRGFAEAVLAAGLHVSFSGIVTFHNAADLRETARRIPAERLLVETDCPYLTPVPVRGKPNEPAFVGHVGQCLAAGRGVPALQLATVTRDNARRLFGLPGEAAPGAPSRVDRGETRLGSTHSTGMAGRADGSPGSG